MEKTRSKYIKIIISGAVVLVLLTTGLMSDFTLKLLFKDKVWAHKVNLTEQYAKAKKQFTGVELDVVFEKVLRNFDIHHPPEPSTGLTLSNYFASQPNNSEVGYWLDFKNLSSDNDSLAAVILDSIVTVYNIPQNKVIVESRDPQYLKKLADKGFKTSYYLPTGLYEQSAEDLKTQLEYIKQTIAANPTTYISFEYRDYLLVKEHFPNSKKISWFTIYGSMNKLSARLLLFQLLMDKQVDVLLIPFEWEENQ